MAKHLVNLTLKLISERVDYILKTHPYSLYKSVIDCSDFQLELIAYILNRVPSLYVVTGDDRPAIRFCLGSSEQFHLEGLIHEGIHVILPKVLKTPPQEFCDLLKSRPYRSKDGKSKPSQGEASQESCQWDELAIYARTKWVEQNGMHIQ
ncbi:late competence development ComFB family protein [Phormidium pseudopriestleyi FRX01]|uniref:Late competence development ComFB family protein n=1 Tax=Phormidium pseudopriestleyi FRX01 TaxID=1759528 RepID=A0ABS3FXC4_9CYAN|nr:late competence development ComFB family protein [Phormidium pseudopriestleyi]MBO0351760.1 late competence development ComFB family protein [Phormidium pseudopriestleyi FRX01]